MMNSSQSPTPESPAVVAPLSQNRSQTTPHQASRFPWLLFSIAAFACVALFAVPAFIIHPFRHQSPRALWLAITLRHHAPAGTALAAVICLGLAFALWRSAGIGRKAVLVFTLILVAFSAGMSRLNYFEWMFHPIDSPQFLAQSAARLDGKEMIMSVAFDQEARAYPIRQMAYHHVLNDLVGGVPVAVTY